MEHYRILNDDHNENILESRESGKETPGHSGPLEGVNQGQSEARGILVYHLDTLRQQKKCIYLFMLIYSNI